MENTSIQKDTGEFQEATMRHPAKLTMDEIRLAIELLEDEVAAGHAVDQHRLCALMRERIRRVRAGLASLR